MKKRYPQKFIAALTAMTFIFTSHMSAPALAQTPAIETGSFEVLPDDFSQVQLPGSMGVVEEAYLKGRDRTVILIQDAHSVPEAQRNIQKLIRYFGRQYGIDLVVLEGVDAQFDLQIFKSFPDKEKLKQVFKTLHDQGELSGPAAAALFNQTQQSFRGVEDWALYEEGLGYYLSARRHEEEIARNLQGWQNDLQTRKEKTYSKILLETDQKIESFQQNETEFVDLLNYLTPLKEPADGTAIAVLAGQMQDTAEQNLALETETKALALKVKQYLERQTAHQEDLSLFNQKEQLYQTSQITGGEFTLFLKELADKYQIVCKISRNLDRRAQGHQKLRDLEGSKLSGDLDEYIYSVKESLFRNQDERNLDSESRRLFLMKKLMRLELSRSEWSELEGEMDYALWTGFKDHIAFYQNARKRDEAMMKRLISEMDHSAAHSKAKAALMITGGFHTQGLTEQFRQKGISYLLLRPGIEKLPEENIYRRQMAGDISWKEYFKVQQGRVNLYEAFVRAVRDQLLGVSDKRKGVRTKTIKDQDEDLSFVADRLMLKQWRDQIIRDLADRNELEKAGRYTRYLDELTDAARDSFHVSQTNWINRIRDFINGLRKLDAAGQVTEQNILNLLKIQTTPVGAVVAWPSRTATLPADLIGIESREFESRQPEVDKPQTADQRRQQWRPRDRERPELRTGRSELKAADYQDLYGVVEDLFKRVNHYPVTEGAIDRGEIIPDLKLNGRPILVSSSDANMILLTLEEMITNGYLMAQKLNRGKPVKVDFSAYYQDDSLVFEMLDNSIGISIDEIVEQVLRLKDEDPDMSEIYWGYLDADVREKLDARQPLQQGDLSKILGVVPMYSGKGTGGVGFVLLKNSIADNYGGRLEIETVPSKETQVVDGKTVRIPSKDSYTKIRISIPLASIHQGEKQKEISEKAAARIESLILPVFQVMYKTYPKESTNALGQAILAAFKTVDQTYQFLNRYDIKGAQDVIAEIPTYLEALDKAADDGVLFEEEEMRLGFDKDLKMLRYMILNLSAMIDRELNTPIDRQPLYKISTRYEVARDWAGALLLPEVSRQDFLNRFAAWISTLPAEEWVYGFQDKRLQEWLGRHGEKWSLHFRRLSPQSDDFEIKIETPEGSASALIFDEGIRSMHFQKNAAQAFRIVQTLQGLERHFLQINPKNNRDANFRYTAAAKDDLVRLVRSLQQPLKLSYGDRNRIVLLENNEPAASVRVGESMAALASWEQSNMNAHRVLRRIWEEPGEIEIISWQKTDNALRLKLADGRSLLINKIGVAFVRPELRSASGDSEREFEKILYGNGLTPSSPLVKFFPEAVKQALLADPALRPVLLRRLPEAVLGDLQGTDISLLEPFGGVNLIHHHSIFSAGSPQTAEKLAEEGVEILVGVTDPFSEDTLSDATYPVANNRQVYFPLEDGTWLAVKGIGQMENPYEAPQRPAEYSGQRHEGVSNYRDLEGVRQTYPGINEAWPYFRQYLGYRELKALPDRSGKLIPVEEITMNGQKPVLIFGRVLSPHRFSKFPQLFKIDPELSYLRRELTKTLKNSGISGDEQYPEDTVISPADWVLESFRWMGRAEAFKQRNHIYKRTIHSQDFSMALGQENDPGELENASSRSERLTRDRRSEAVLDERLRATEPFTDNVSVVGLATHVTILIEMIRHIREIAPQNEEFFLPDKEKVLRELFTNYFENVGEEYRDLWTRPEKQADAETLLSFLYKQAKRRTPVHSVEAILGSRDPVRWTLNIAREIYGGKLLAEEQPDVTASEESVRPNVIEPGESAAAFGIPLLGILPLWILRWLGLSGIVKKKEAQEKIDGHSELRTDDDFYGEFNEVLTLLQAENFDGTIEFLTRLMPELVPESRWALWAENLRDTAEDLKAYRSAGYESQMPKIQREIKQQSHFRSHENYSYPSAWGLSPSADIAAVLNLSSDKLSAIVSFQRADPLTMALIEYARAVDGITVITVPPLKGIDLFPSYVVSRSSSVARKINDLVTRYRKLGRQPDTDYALTLGVLLGYSRETILSNMDLENLHRERLAHSEIEHFWRDERYHRLKALIIKYADVPGMGGLMVRLMTQYARDSLKGETSSHFKEIAGELFLVDDLLTRIPGAEVLAFEQMLGTREIDAFVKIPQNAEMTSDPASLKPGLYLIEGKEGLSGNPDVFWNSTLEKQIIGQLEQVRLLHSTGFPVEGIIVAAGDDRYGPEIKQIGKIELVRSKPRIGIDDQRKELAGAASKNGSDTGPEPVIPVFTFLSTPFSVERDAVLGSVVSPDESTVRRWSHEGLMDTLDLVRLLGDSFTGAWPPSNEVRSHAFSRLQRRAESSKEAYRKMAERVRREKNQRRIDAEIDRGRRDAEIEEWSEWFLDAEVQDEQFNGDADHNLKVITSVLTDYFRLPVPLETLRDDLQTHLRQLSDSTEQKVIEVKLPDKPGFTGHVITTLNFETHSQETWEWLKKVSVQAPSVRRKRLVSSNLVTARTKSKGAPRKLVAGDAEAYLTRTAKVWLEVFQDYFEDTSEAEQVLRFYFGKPETTIPVQRSLLQTRIARDSKEKVWQELMEDYHRRAELRLAKDDFEFPPMIEDFQRKVDDYRLQAMRAWMTSDARRVEYMINTASPLWVRGGLELKFILDELINNALDAQARGRVQVSLSREEAADKPGYAVLRVTNRGKINWTRLREKAQRNIGSLFVDQQGSLHVRETPLNGERPLSVEEIERLSDSQLLFIDGLSTKENGGITFLVFGLAYAAWTVLHPFIPWWGSLIYALAIPAAWAYIRFSMMPRGGRGIGLYHSRNHIINHDGNIRVITSTDATTFEIRLPLASQRQIELYAPKKDQPPKPELRVQIDDEKAAGKTWQGPQFEAEVYDFWRALVEKDENKQIDLLVKWHSEGILPMRYFMLDQAYWEQTVRNAVIQRVPENVAHAVASLKWANQLTRRFAAFKYAAIPSREMSEVTHAIRNTGQHALSTNVETGAAAKGWILPFVKEPYDPAGGKQPEIYLYILDSGPGMPVRDVFENEYRAPTTGFGQDLSGFIENNADVIIESGGERARPGIGVRLSPQHAAMPSGGTLVGIHLKSELRSPDANLAISPAVNFFGNLSETANVAPLEGPSPGYIRPISDEVLNRALHRLPEFILQGFFPDDDIPGLMYARYQDMRRRPIVLNQMDAMHQPTGQNHLFSEIGLYDLTNDEALSFELTFRGNIFLHNLILTKNPIFKQSIPQWIRERIEASQPEEDKLIDEGVWNYPIESIYENGILHEIGEILFLFLPQEMQERWKIIFPLAQNQDGRMDSIYLRTLLYSKGEPQAFAEESFADKFAAFHLQEIYPVMNQFGIFSNPEESAFVEAVLEYFRQKKARYGKIHILDQPPSELRGQSKILYENSQWNIELLETLVSKAAQELGFEAAVVGGTRYLQSGRRSDIDIALNVKESSDPGLVKRYFAELIRQMEPYGIRNSSAEPRVDHNTRLLKTALFQGAAELTFDLYASASWEARAEWLLSRFKIVSENIVYKRYLELEYYLGDAAVYQQALEAYRTGGITLDMRTQVEKRIAFLRQKANTGVHQELIRQIVERSLSSISEDLAAATAAETFASELRIGSQSQSELRSAAAMTVQIGVQPVIEKLESILAGLEQRERLGMDTLIEGRPVPAAVLQSEIQKVIAQLQKLPLEGASFGYVLPDNQDDVRSFTRVIRIFGRMIRQIFISSSDSSVNIPAGLQNVLDEYDINLSRVHHLRRPVIYLTDQVYAGVVGRSEDFEGQNLDETLMPVTQTAGDVQDDPLMAELVLALQVAASLLVARKVRSKADRYQLQAEAVSLLKDYELFPGFESKIIQVTENGLSVSGRQVLLYLEWAAQQSIRQSA